MEKIHLLLLLSGLFSLSGAIRYLQLFELKKTWDDARSYCRENCIDLATIEDMEEMQTLLKEHQTFPFVWIGLSSGSSLNWHWSFAQKDYKEGEMDDLIWSNETPEGSCGAFENGKFSTPDCELKLHAVCFDEKGPQQYVLTNQMMTWTSALELCRTQHTDLASVRNADERQTLQEVVGAQRVWTGLFRDPWTWSDGSDSSFRYWIANTPIYGELQNRRCTVLNFERWNTRKCSFKLNFFCTCEKSFKKILKVRISSKDSGLDLNDPAVKEDILKQMKEKMSLTEVGLVQWRANRDGRVFVKEPENNQRSDSECEVADTKTP